MAGTADSASAVSSLGLARLSAVCPVVEGLRELCGVSSYKGVNPIHEPLTSSPKHLPEARPPNTVTLGIRLSIRIRGRRA